MCVHTCTHSVLVLKVHLCISEYIPILPLHWHSSTSRECHECAVKHIPTTLAVNSTNRASCTALPILYPINQPSAEVRFALIDGGSRIVGGIWTGRVKLGSSGPGGEQDGEGFLQGDFLQVGFILGPQHYTRLLRLLPAQTAGRDPSSPISMAGV